MGYCVIDDVKSLVPEQVMIRLSVASEMMQERIDTISEDDQIIQKYIDLASAEIDGYIGGRVLLPLPEPYPGMLIKLCIDIAAYSLYSLVRDTNMPEVRKHRYDDAVRFLEMFASGRGHLASGASAAMVKAKEPIFNMSVWRAFRGW